MDRTEQLTSDTPAVERTPIERVLFLTAASLAVLMLFVAARLTLATRTGTIDSYYYFARAADLNEGTPLAETKLNWGDGVDRKFFPGYPLLLHWLSFGSAPERAWRSIAVLLVLVNPILLGLGMRRLGLSFGASCATVALFCSSFVPLNWMTMPMAESTALLWLGFSAMALPLRGDPLPTLYTRFLLSCFLGGMAILSRAEAAYPAGLLGVVGLHRMWGQRGFLFVAAAGASLGVAPFAYWVSSLPPAGVGESRLHYVNEFFANVSIRDSDDGHRGGILDNFLRSCWHPVFNWGRIPFTVGLPRGPLTGEFEILRAVWMAIWLGSIAFAAIGFGGPRARRFAIAYLGFMVFRSFWYYPYDRFLVTGLPMGFASMALLGQHLAERSRAAAWAVGILFVAWVARGTENYVNYHAYHRIPENGTHSYRDDAECNRLQYLMQYTRFPLEGADVAILAARRFTKRMASEERFSGNPYVKRKEKVALEFPWPQICYAMRPRPIVLGYPLVNFWGEAQYRRYETVPLDANGEPVRPPRRALDYLRDEGARYVITPLPLTRETSLGPEDGAYGTWAETKGLEPGEISSVVEIDRIRERTNFHNKYEWPLFVRVYELRFPGAAADPGDAREAK